MRAWLYLLGGLIVWAVHFFALYAVASLFLTSTTARVLTLLVTFACLAAAALLLRHARRARREDPLQAWTDRLAAWSGALAIAAILWQGLPAILI